MARHENPDDLERWKDAVSAALEDMPPAQGPVRRRITEAEVDQMFYSGMTPKAAASLIVRRTS